jgi:hypothetical protein
MFRDYLTLNSNKVTSRFGQGVLQSAVTRRWSRSVDRSGTENGITGMCVFTATRRFGRITRSSGTGVAVPDDCRASFSRQRSGAPARLLESPFPKNSYRYYCLTDSETMDYTRREDAGGAANGERDFATEIATRRPP